MEFRNGWTKFLGKYKRSWYVSMSAPQLGLGEIDYDELQHGAINATNIFYETSKTPEGRTDLGMWYVVHEIK